MLFKEISLDSKKELDPYFDLVDYEGCEYCFSTLYMWQHVYKTEYYIGKDFAVLIGEYEGDSFSILPLAKKEKIPEIVEFIFSFFKDSNKKILLRGITHEVLDYLKEKYGDKFNYIEERDLFDYIYDAESLRTLAGRKNQKKRNHINSFLKEYEGRYECRLLGKSDFQDCVSLLKAWEHDKEENEDYDESMNDELFGILKILNHYDVLKDKVKVYGVFIDGKLQAFSIGEYLSDKMALIHVEKADPSIRGLYPFINQQFLVNQFPDVDFVNREEDMGLEGLRKAKLSYHPVRFVEKYTVKEK
ncbi:MAG: phosphatidylglycerol lysyltransferase domain-containing protein [Clostridioides sp.]|jgi:hypothetical protein|nr:phosphatidylglycerol lysyltransferase domain-containing protein [Clostridioides sp.]